MAGAVAHFEQARRNRAFADNLIARSLDDPTARQWIATVLFYVAVHCVDGYLAGQVPPVHPENHGQRFAAMRSGSNHVPGMLRRAYSRLYDRSMFARYGIGRFSPDMLGDLRDLDLRPIADFVRL